MTQHYSASPVCAPARASLLTGRYPQRTGAIDTTEMRGLDRMAPGERTVADLLRAAGYATGLVGKWHDGALDPRHHPTARGFAEFAGFCGGWSPAQLFDLERDPGETTDLAAREPERVRGMEADLARWFEAVEIGRRAAASALSA